MAITRLLQAAQSAKVKELPTAYCVSMGKENLSEGLPGPTWSAFPVFFGLDKTKFIKEHGSFSFWWKRNIERYDHESKTSLEKAVESK